MHNPPGPRCSIEVAAGDALCSNPARVLVQAYCLSPLYLKRFPFARDVANVMDLCCAAQLRCSTHMASSERPYSEP